ncbi:MAG: PHP domain-containing protein, partial [Methanosarcinales archaeon]|nr:PHP domain-containing protein [Methanosarcinales archaeon]
MTLRFDMHVHTCYSRDSKASVDDILDHAIAIGLDGIAICDHDTVEGGLFAQKRVSERG